MDTLTSLAIGGVVGVLSKFVMMSGIVTGRTMTLWVVALTTFVFAVWGYSHSDFNRASSWNYLVEWANTLVASAATFHGANEAVKSIQGTGDGTVGTARFQGDK